MKEPVYDKRVATAAEKLEDADVRCLLLCPGKGWHYFTGQHAGLSERLYLVAITAEGKVGAVVPSFEVSRHLRDGLPNVRGWQEHEDPCRYVAALLDDLGAVGGAVAIDPETPYEVYERLWHALPTCTLINGREFVDALSMIKTPEELACIEKASEIVAKQLAVALAQFQLGMTEKELSKIIAQASRELGGNGGALVQGGPNTALPHGAPSDRPVQKGDALVIDTGASVEGYSTDVTRTFAVGVPTEKLLQVYSIVECAQEAGISALRVGESCESVDIAARKVIAEAGFGPYFTHRVGHGIGLTGHEYPYLVGGNTLLLQPGMTFTVEPGIYVEGEFGVRIEDVVTVTEEGPRVLSHMVPKEFLVLGG